MTDCFSIGSTVAVTTCYDELIEGQVMAFDLTTKLLVLSKFRFDFFFLAFHSVLDESWNVFAADIVCWVLSVVKTLDQNTAAAALNRKSAHVAFFLLTHFSESNSETNSKLNDVFIVNLLFCKNIDVKKELNGAENHNQEPQSINLQRVSIQYSATAYGTNKFAFAVK